MEDSQVDAEAKKLEQQTEDEKMKLEIAMMEQRLADKLFDPSGADVK